MSARRPRTPPTASGPSRRTRGSGPISPGFSLENAPVSRSAVRACAHGGMSLRAFARHIGVDESAVRKAIRTGRLRKSIGYHWRCPCGYCWESVGLGPDDAGPDALHDCPMTRAKQ